jgi:glycosyltransferase involved in cell wall biosynthesis
MRLLLAIHNAYTDYTSGAAHSMRIIMQWLAEDGHECRVIATARFDGTPPESIDGHLSGLGVPVHTNPPSRLFARSVRKPPNVQAGRATAAFTLRGVPVTMLLTHPNQGDAFVRMENDQYLFLFEQIVREFEPDVLLTYGAQPVLQEVMRRARRRGITTVFSLRNRGYEDRRWFAHADYVLTEPYLSEHYRQAIGLASTGIESPIDWAEVVAPEDLRQFVTFVNPTPRKGLALFARLADMLGASRPDIPLLVVQSTTTAGGLNSFPDIDFAKYPHILAAPPTPRPADFLALTKILLVPSVSAEAFGRVAAEAMINGIPPLVSNRGALPATVAGSGRVLPIPEWLTDDNPLQLPSPDDVRPWFDAVCELWDDPQRYGEDSERARQTAERLYSEGVLKRRHLDFFASLARPGRPFD